MRINDSSICTECVNFWHECGIGDPENDCCSETCSCQAEEIVNRFYDSDDPIVNCSHHRKK